VAVTFSPKSREIFAKKVLLHVASLDPDGRPNVTPVWCELDGDDIIINTALGRAKARNLATDSRVACSLVDPDDPYTAIAIRGNVTAFTTDGADENIDRLAKKYFDVDTYPFRKEGEVRVIVRITPEVISQQPS
jgi:PPOX class probable F420-dependent enzyme